jgi:hypothetical protein
MDNQAQQPQPQQPPKPKSKKLLWIFLFFLLLIVAAAIFWFFWSYRTSNSGAKEQGFSGELKKKVAKIDKSLSVTKTFSTAGDTMSVRSSDGTLYTLTVPPDALILPSTVTMSVLTESPVTNWDKPAAGYGVFLDGKFSFIRPAYITIQPNTQMPTLGKTKAVDWGRCNIASRGYDPEICAGNNKIPLRGGVEPGKVIVFVNSKDDEILLTPTIPTKANVYNGFVFDPGAYFGYKINKKQAEQLADRMFAGSNDYINRAETLMHLWALGGDLTKYKDEIERFAREKKDYPREVLKGAIIAKVVKDDKAYNARVSDFKTVIERNLNNIKGAFLPIPRYFALLNQLSTPREKGSANSAIAVFAEDTGLGAWPDDLPWYDEDARQDTGGSSWAEDMKKRSDQMLRNLMGSKTAFCFDKFQAAESLEALGTLDAADRDAINSILSQCNKKCATLEECEKAADDAKRNGNSDALTEALYRMTAFLEQGTDCKALVKKDLSNYGQNFCQ